MVSFSFCQRTDEAIIRHRTTVRPLFPHGNDGFGLANAFEIGYASKHLMELLVGAFGSLGRSV
jgi:hypothetical protein